MRTRIAGMLGVALVVLLSGEAAAQIVPGAVPGTDTPAGWALSWAANLANGANQAAESGKLTDLMNDFKPLSPDDKGQDAAYPPGPGLPSACSEQPQACAACGFNDALVDLQSTRYRLEKLRRVYASTKNMTSHALAVGDSLAGSAGVGGLAWVSERAKILQSVKNLQAAYDAKYAELMKLLEGSLQKISACEQVVYGERDWYQRFGFMYNQFMAGRYERAD